MTAGTRDWGLGASKGKGSNGSGGHGLTRMERDSFYRSKRRQRRTDGGWRGASDQQLGVQGSGFRVHRQGSGFRAQIPTSSGRSVPAGEFCSEDCGFKFAKSGRCGGLINRKEHSAAKPQPKWSADLQSALARRMSKADCKSALRPFRRIFAACEESRPLQCKEYKDF